MRHGPLGNHVIVPRMAAVAERIDGWPNEVVGNGLPVPILAGGRAPYAYLDNAASTPPLVSVMAAVNAFVPWYSSVHRGAGYKSRVATRAYEEAREHIRQFLRVPDEQVVVFVRNTTEGMNRLAILAAERGATVFASIMEHHSNLLPWRKHGPVVHFGADRDGVLDEEDLRARLSAARPGPKIVTVAGVYNVSGYVAPIHRLARIAHEHGAEIVVDAAQLAPHQRIDMRGAPGEEIDYLVFSAHKIYAPFGSGALVAPRAALSAASPAVVGGGIVDLVSLDEVVWNEPPDREEAGTPNVVGAVALGAALVRLEALGRDVLEAQERALAGHLLDRLRDVHGLRVLGPRGRGDRMGLVSFVLEGVPHALVAAVLSFEHGIGIRTGCFCAQPGVLHMLGLPSDEVRLAIERMRRHEHGGLPGAVRVSLGLQNTQAEVDRLVDALHQLVRSGPGTEYRLMPATGEYVALNWYDVPPPELAASVAGAVA